MMSAAAVMFEITSTWRRKHHWPCKKVMTTPSWSCMPTSTVDLQAHTDNLSPAHRMRASMGRITGLAWIKYCLSWG